MADIMIMAEKEAPLIAEAKRGGLTDFPPYVVLEIKADGASIKIFANSADLAAIHEASGQGVTMLVNEAIRENGKPQAAAEEE